jgi:hypothetical protein
MKKLPTKLCAQMSNSELAAFIKQGAWRENANSPDASAYAEAAKRLKAKNA